MNLASRTYVWCFFLPFSYQKSLKIKIKPDGWEQKTTRPRIKPPTVGNFRAPSPFVGQVPVHVYRKVDGAIQKWAIEYHEFDETVKGGKGKLLKTIYTNGSAEARHVYQE